MHIRTATNRNAADVRDLAEVQRRGPGSKADDNHPTRHELLDAALQVADREGLTGFTVAAVIAQAGVARGTFYIHFSDRSELLLAVHERFHHQLFNAIDEVTQHLPCGTDRMVERLRTFLDECRRQPGVRSMLRDARAEPMIAVHTRERNLEAARYLAEDFRHRSRGAKTARLLVAAATEAATAELEEHRTIPEIRTAVFDLAKCLAK